MKRVLLFLLFFCIVLGKSFCTVINVTLKKGEYYKIIPGAVGYNYFTPLEPSITYSGEAAAIIFHSRLALYIWGVNPGYSYVSFMNSNGISTTYSFQVLDVIPENVDMTVGNTYTYTPVAEMGNGNYAIKSFSWASDNEGVAQIDANGCVTAISPGKATITATANLNLQGTQTNTFKSIITVSTQPVQKVTLDRQQLDMNIGEEVALTVSIAPENATDKTVKWLSTNENIAQVDDEGNVIAIAPGYCSIYAKADDGSSKFGKCLVHVTGAESVRGDMNGDGRVTATDAVQVIDIILEKE